MSYFNSEQTDHMAYLSSRDPATLCWCGWYPLGKCPGGCGEHSCAEKIKAKCSKCGNAPWRPGEELIHVVTCPSTRGAP